MKAFIYNGQTGETLGELTGAHKGSIVSNIILRDHYLLLTLCRWLARGARILRIC